MAMSSLISPNCLLFQIDQISFEERNKNPVSYPDGVPKITSQDSSLVQGLAGLRFPLRVEPFPGHLEWIWVSLESSILAAVVKTFANTNLGRLGCVFGED